MQYSSISVRAQFRASHIIPPLIIPSSAVTAVMSTSLLLLSFLCTTHVYSLWVAFSRFSFASKYILSVNLCMRLQVLMKAKGSR